MNYKETPFGKIPEHWGVGTILENSKLVTDYVANGSFASLKENVQYKNEPDYAILIRLVDFNNEFDGNFVYLSRHSYDFLKKSKLFGNEIIISNVGANVGTVFKAPSLSKPMSLGPNSIMFIPKGDNDFYYYWMKSRFGQHMLKSIVSGSAQPKFNKTDFRRLEIPVPPINEQKEIGSILRSLDDRIAENKKINHHLELMAQAIFKSWFIDYENSTDFVETEIGMIPSSWKVVSLSEIAEISNGYSYKGKELKESSTAMATIKNFDRNGGFKSNGFKELVPSDKIKPTHFVSINEILIAHTDLTQNADIIGNSEILLNDFGYDAIVASMDLVKINSKISGISNYTLLLMTKNELFKQYCLGFVNGTTVLHLSKKAVPNYKLAIPSSEKIFKEFNSLVEPLFERMKVVIKENESLISLRDSLLPKLMSGEIKVCDYAAK